MGPRRSGASPIGWSAIIAGAVVAISTWLFLHLFGIGIGLIAIDPDRASSLKAVGIGTGIWSLIAPLIALFLGGLVAGRVAPTASRLTAGIHGTVVWGLTCLLAIVATLMVLGAVLRGTASATSAVAGAASPGQLQGLPDMLGIDAQDLVAPINQRLQEQGMPRVTPEQLQRVVQDAIDVAMRQGGIDRQALVEIAARDTALSRAQAEQVASQLETEINTVVRRGRGVASQAQHAALQAAESTGKVIFWGSVMMFLGLCAAVGGAIVSVPRGGREDVEMPRATATTTQAP